MQKYRLLLIILASLALGACKRTLIILPGGSVTGTTNSSSYQPVTKGSYWKYRASASVTGAPDTSTQTATGATAIFNGQTYYEVSTISRTFPTPNLGYYHVDNHQFTTRATTLVNGITMEFYFMNDTMAVNHTWTSPLTDNGLVNGLPGRIAGKILEKGISKTVSGKSFPNVIHTQLDLQYDYGVGSGYTTSLTYDYYIAKGIGIIKIDTSNKGVVFASTDIIEYNIK